MSRARAALFTLPALVLALVFAKLPARTPGVEPLLESAESMFTADGKMRVPVQYREWIFLSSGLDMNYQDAAEAGGHPEFDNVFVQPAAYRAFLRTRSWPDGTILVREDRGASAKGSINKHGKFQTVELLGIEAHVKNSQHFKGSWGFFAWPALDSAAATLIPAAAPCYSCHQQHGAIDTTFVQFYPTLVGLLAHPSTPTGH